MSQITVYKQSKAFFSLSQSTLFRLSLCTGGCISSYVVGKKLCRYSNSPRKQEYGQIAKHYGKFCGAILWGHVLVASAGGLYYAKVFNLPRAVYFQRGLVYGETMGFGTMVSYIVAREVSSREWFAQIFAGGYSGLKFGLLQNLKGWKAYHATRMGLWGGFWLFICYSTFHFLAEIWTIFCEPNLKYSEWEKFDTEELLYHRVKQFFYVENWMRWFDDKRVEKGIKRARFEMDELEELMRQAGLTREELQFVDFATVSDTMFDILEANKTGRPEFDNMNSTTTSTVLARYRQFDPHYETTSGTQRAPPGGSMAPEFR